MYIKEKNGSVEYPDAPALSMGRSPSHKSEKVMVPRWAKEQDAHRKKKYPGCRGTFPECPPEIKAEVDPECSSCPLYRG